MTKDEWKESYISRLMAKSDFSRKDAEANFRGIDDALLDLTESPVETADEELSYWADDEERK